jgi:hypothetical protein
VHIFEMIKIQTKGLDVVLDYANHSMFQKKYIEFVNICFTSIILHALQLATDH